MQSTKMSLIKGRVNMSGNNLSIKSAKTISTLMIVTALIGVGVSYSSLYLFHIILVFSSLYIFIQWIILKFKPVSILKSLFPFNTYFLVFTLLWFAALLPFTVKPNYAVMHLMYLIIGFSVIFIVNYLVKSQSDFKVVYQSAKVTLAINLFIGFLESLGIFRWFISRLSPWVAHFGYPVELNKILDESISKEYVYTMPTGFQYNPNDFAVIAGMALPFFLTLRNSLISIPASLLIIWLCVASGAKIVLISCIMMLLLSLFFVSGKKLIAPLISILFVISIITNGFGLLKGKYIKINETQALFYHMAGLELPKYNLHVAEVKKSGAMRKDLIKFGLKKSLDNYLWGYGGGQVRYHREAKTGDAENKIGNLHNFWIELLMEGGIIYLLVFILWYLYLLWMLFRIYRHSLNPETKIFTVSLIICMCGFVVSSNAPSSVIYYLPMYVMFAFAIITINLNKT